MRVSHWALLALVCCAGCVTAEPKTLPELQAGTEERSYYKPITNHRLEFRQVGNNVFETGKKAVVTFRLKNQGKKTVRIDEWRMKDDDNVLLYCQPWLPGMKEPDPDGWISLAEPPAKPVRDEDQVALSSRNAYLSPAERERARILSQSLFAAREAIRNGTPIPQVKQTITNAISNKADKVDYVEIYDSETLEDPSPDTSEVLIALAAFFGKTRLIDNLLVSLK